MTIQKNWQELIRPNKLQVTPGSDATRFATVVAEPLEPLALKGKDVAGQSQTGTGKTAAFLIAAFTRCLRTPAPPRRPASAVTARAPLPARARPEDRGPKSRDTPQSLHLSL